MTQAKILNINLVEEIKYLNICIDRPFPHTVYNKETPNNTLQMSNPKRTCKHVKELYYALVHCSIIYALTVWGVALKVNLDTV